MNQTIIHLRAHTSSMVDKYRECLDRNGILYCPLSSHFLLSFSFSFLVCGIELIEPPHLISGGDIQRVFQGGVFTYINAFQMACDERMD